MPIHHPPAGPPAPPAEAVASRLVNHSDRLFEALEDLEASGGLRGIGMSDRAKRRLTKLLAATRAAIDEALAEGPR